MLTVQGIIKRYSSLLVVVTLCIGISIVCPSTALSDILKKIRPTTNKDELEKIYQYKLDQGIKNLSVFSSFLLRSSRNYLDQGEIEKAVECAEYAQLLAPSYPPNYTHLGKVYWAQNRFRFFSMVTGWIDSFSATFNNYPFAVFGLANFLLFFLLSFLFAITVFSVTSVYKYFKLFIHDLHHLLPFKFPLTLLILWGIVVFSLPFFFHWSIFLICFFWLSLLFIYHSKREQQIAIIFVFFLLLSPFIIKLISGFVVTSYSGVFSQLYQVNEEAWDRETEQELIKWTAKYPNDVDALFSLGLLKKREGDYEEAKRYYEKILGIDPAYHRALCNLGNVLLATKKVDLAIESYNQSIEIYPASVESYYNLSRAYLLNNYMFEESNENFNKAKKLGADRVDYYSRIYSNNMNRIVIDETIPLSVFWEKTFEPTEEKKLFNSSLWDRFFRGIPFTYRYSVLFIFLLFVCLLFINHHECDFSVGCEYCGSAVCGKCRRLVYEDNFCKKCASIFRSRGDQSITTREKEKKVMQIERFQKRYIIIGRILSILFPGAGHLWAGYPLKGSAMIFLFFFLLLKLAYWDGIIMNPWLMSHARSYGGITIVASMVLILYLYSILDFNRISVRLSQFLSLIIVTRKELQIKK